MRRKRARLLLAAALFASPLLLHLSRCFIIIFFKFFVFSSMSGFLLLVLHDLFPAWDSSEIPLRFLCVCEPESSRPNRFFEVFHLVSILRVQYGGSMLNLTLIVGGKS